MITGGVPIARSIHTRLRLINLRQERLVCQDIINPIVRIAELPVIRPMVSLRICQRNIIQTIRALARTENLLNGWLILGVIKIAVHEQVYVRVLPEHPVNMLPEQARLVPPQERFPRRHRQLGLQMGAYQAEPVRRVHFDRDI